MSSWANLRAVSGKKKEPTIRYYFSSSSSDYATSTLSFLYSLFYTQRSAETFFAVDTEGFFQPLLNTNPIIHYLKEQPSTGTNLYEELFQTVPVLSMISFQTLKRTIKGMYQLNIETSRRIDAFLSNFGIIRQKYDVGLVLTCPEDVTAAFSGLKALQKRIGRKTLNIFVMTENIDLLRDFAKGGDPSWSYMSLLRNNSSTDKEYLLLKTLSEIQLLQKIPFLAVRLSSPLGKLLYLISEEVSTESQVVSLDGSSWKVLE